MVRVTLRALLALSLGSFASAQVECIPLALGGVTPGATNLPPFPYWTDGDFQLVAQLPGNCEGAACGFVFNIDIWIWTNGVPVAGEVKIELSPPPAEFSMPVDLPPAAVPPAPLPGSFGFAVQGFAWSVACGTSTEFTILAHFPLPPAPFPPFPPVRMFNLRLACSGCS